ncbi:hypothetical protein HYV58_01215 [Candidatus Peregrinibacteria bacterium]|nr:hypothetical protein [Candidatus Peregrinibacteria bacterium]
MSNEKTAWALRALGLGIFAAAVGTFAIPGVFFADRTSQVSLIHAGTSTQTAESLQRAKYPQNIICFRQKSLADGTLTVTIKAGDIREKIFGTAFTLHFDASAARFLRRERGDFFERGGEPLSIVRFISGAGVVAGITLKRGDRLQNGSGDIMSFSFRNLTAKDPEFRFLRTAVFTRALGARKEVRDVRWGDCEALIRP